jgi:hypothetical protein
MHLAAAFAICTAIYPPRSEAASVTVSNCNDNGSGSLRSAVFRAASGDTVDLRGLTCGRITLVTGEIAVPQDDLALLGPGRLALTVSGNRISRVIDHEGRGTLRIQGLSLSYGYIEGPSLLGACIQSSGRVELRNARVHHCFGHLLHALETDGAGAGVYASNSLFLSYSSVFANRFDGDTPMGGGIFTGGRLVMDHSQLYDNAASGGGGGVAQGGATLSYSIIQNNVVGGSWGGLFVSGGDVAINKSTISGNQANACGGLCIGASEATEPALVIADSTFSGNVGTNSAIGAPRVVIYNSTIARNSEPEPGDVFSPCQGAVVAGRLSLQSTIVAANTCFSVPGPDIGALADPSLQVGGFHNLVGMSRAPIPADTIRAAPRLGSLAWNGGPTRTHALLCDSPAIDRGSNVLKHAYDQRGPGYDRVRGVHADIGAFEVQNPATCSSSVSQP